MPAASANIIRNFQGVRPPTAQWLPTKGDFGTSDMQLKIKVHQPLHLMEGGMTAYRPDAEIA
jgi:hypothetical protein